MFSKLRLLSRQIKSAPSSPITYAPSIPITYAPSSLLNCPNGFLIRDNNYYQCKPTVSPSSLNCINGYTLLPNNRAVCNPNINSPMVLNCPNGFISIKDHITKNANYYACKPV